MSEEITQGVKILLGDPRKAVLKLSFPMMIGMLSSALYNIVDGIWVAGLGHEALSAIGLFFPLFMIVISLSSGIGIGGSSAVSRSIGEKNQEKASLVAMHTIVIGIFLGSLLTLLLIFYLKDIFNITGARGETAQLALNYGKLIALSSIFLAFSHIGSGILRGEGDTNRAMYALVLGAGLNIILDPLFIYYFRLGIEGAALATLLSIFISSIPIAYWLFFPNNTYVKIKFKHFSFKKKILGEILGVGIPACFAQLSMATAMFILNIIVVKTGGDQGIAVFTSAWRIIMLGTVPLLGVAIGVTAVCGAAYGAKDIIKLREGFLYAIKAGFIFEAITASLVIIFAPKIALIFTYSQKSYAIYQDLVQALRLLILFLPATPLGFLTSAMFQGINKGLNSLIVTILRTIIMQVLFSYFLGVVLKWGLIGVWLGIVMGNLIATVITFNWGRAVIRNIKF